MLYLRGKADWMLRGLPCEPTPSMLQKLRALPYFINNLAPGIRSRWIALSNRRTVAQSMNDDLSRLHPTDSIATSIARTDVIGVVLSSDGVLLGAIEPDSKSAHAIDAMNPAPQTIRPDMTHRLATQLLREHRYILTTTSYGKYLGHYEPPPT
jgi:hypothetical protein